jgi:hypothetical protein
MTLVETEWWHYLDKAYEKRKVELKTANARASNAEAASTRLQEQINTLTAAAETPQMVSVPTQTTPRGHDLVPRKRAHHASPPSPSHHVQKKLKMVMFDQPGKTSNCLRC